jgi:hypothetical protein
VFGVSKVNGDKLADDSLLLHQLGPAVRSIKHDSLHTQLLALLKDEALAGVT